jgi:hypothetical protein
MFCGSSPREQRRSKFKTPIPLCPWLTSTGQSTISFTHRDEVTLYLQNSDRAEDEAQEKLATGWVSDDLRRRLRTWTTDLKARRIRVNAVSPGATDTPGLNKLLASTETGQERLKTISATVPLGRLGTSDEIAKAVVFLASDDSSYITGTELFVDGGFAQV